MFSVREVNWTPTGRRKEVEDYWTGDPASAHLLEVLMPLQRCWNDPTEVVFMFLLPCWPYEVSWGTLGFEDMSEL